LSPLYFERGFRVVSGERAKMKKLPEDPAKLKLLSSEYILKHCKALEKKLDAFKKQLEEINLVEWLDKNYPKNVGIDKAWHLYGANLIGTLKLFIDKELLGKIE